MGAGEGKRKGGHARDLNSAGGEGVGELRARTWCLPLANLFLRGANRERGGKGRQVGGEGGAAWGVRTVKPTGRIHTKIPEGGEGRG